MMRRVPAILAALVLCVACAEVEVPSPTPTIPPSATPEPTASPTPEPTASPTPEPRRLNVCLSEEPDSLYIYGTDSPAARHVWEAIYDGPIDNRRYTYQPVILTELPSLDDGTAVVETVLVGTGDLVLASGGHVLALAPGVIVEDAEGSQVAFDGAPIAMARMVVTFTLRSDLSWADGEPLTADDSIFSFEVAADPATPTDKHVIERTAAYRAVGARQVVWEGVPGFLDQGYVLNFWHPLPHHQWEDLSAVELVSSPRSTREPLGWGPFTIREWIQGERLELERNPFYFRADEGLPRLDEVTFHFFDGAGELAADLVAGSCDVVTHEAGSSVLGVVDEEDLGPTIRPLTTHDAAWEHLAFGISPALGYERPDFFEDARVRRGIALCIDRRAVARASSVSDDRVAHSYVPPEHPLYGGEELLTWDYDPEAGRGYLDQAGWRDLDGDGVRQAQGIPGIADGTPFRITYHTSDAPFRLDGARVVKEGLGACGIEVSLQVLAPHELFAPGPDGVVFGRRFDLVQFAWGVTNIPLCDLFLSSQMPTERNWSRPNVAGFISAEYDDACRKALNTLPNSEDYVGGHLEAQRVFSEQLPVLPLFGHQRVTLVRDGVTGVIPTPSSRSELWNLEQISVER